MSVELVSPDTTAEASARILASGRISIDTEFHAEHRYLPELFLVQLGLRDGTVLLVDPLVPGVIAALGPALRAVPWIAHAAEHDLRILAAALGGLPPAVWDTQIAVGLVSTEFPLGYAAACKRWLGVDVDKGETLSDWSRRPLTSGQLAYAAADVLHLGPLHDALRSELERRGRLGVFEAACADAFADAIASSGAARAYGEVAAGPSLDEEAAARLFALVSWREARARAANQPPRAIAGDAVLVDLARKAPATTDQIRQNRRFPKSVARHTDELVAVLAAPPPVPPRIPRKDSSEARVSAFVQLYAQVIGSARGFAPRLVLPREWCDRVACDRSAIDGWRAELLADLLEPLLAGRTSLALSDGDVRATSR